MKAEDLVQLIRKRYEGTDYVVLEQVPNGTGAYQSRWIDAAAFSLWPSKGLTRSAFEIKVTRSDFIHELQNAHKHQWAKECFHEFWFVAPKDVVQIDELPDGAGLMQPRGNRLVIKKHCRRNDSPLLDDHLLAAFMRAAHKEILAVAERDKREILQSDKGHIDALAYREAVRIFLESRGITRYFSDNTAEIIKAALEEATLDKELKQEREQLLFKLGDFQRNMASLFGIFAIIAHRSLLERNDLGEFIISKFGGNDDEALETIRKLQKGNAFMGRYADLVDTIIKWDTEFKP